MVQCKIIHDKLTKYYLIKPSRMNTEMAWNTKDYIIEKSPSM